MSELPRLAEFPHHATDTVRYGDTDRQGHVNNAVFATFLESGRTQLLREPILGSLPPGTAFVLAHLSLDYVGEITWPGSVDIGTRIATIGRSSVRFEQAIFQDQHCVATAQTVTVMVDLATRKSTPLSDGLKRYFQSFAQHESSHE